MLAPLIGMLLFWLMLNTLPTVIAVFSFVFIVYPYGLMLMLLLSDSYDESRKELRDRQRVREILSEIRWDSQNRKFEIDDLKKSILEELRFLLLAKEKRIKLRGKR